MLAVCTPTEGFQTRDTVANLGSTYASDKCGRIAAVERLVFNLFWYRIRGPRISGTTKIKERIRKKTAIVEGSRRLGELANPTLPGLPLAAFENLEISLHTCCTRVPGNSERGVNNGYLPVVC